MSDSEQSTKAKAFLADLIEVCKKHHLSLGHEDGHGNFLVKNFDEQNISWLAGAYDDTTP